MARRMGPIKIIGVLLVIAGVMVLAFGIYQLYQYNTSFAGKVSNKATGVFNKLTGQSKISKGMIRPIILIVGGAAGTLAGFALTRRP